MIHVVPLLVSALLGLQEQSAEDTLRQIEETVAKARTFSVVVEAQSRSPRTVRSVASGRKSETVHATLLLKEGDKVNLSVLTRNGPTRRTELSIISDGQKGRFPPGKELEDTPEGLNSFLAAVVTRAGLVQSRRMLTRVFETPGLPTMADLKSQLKLSNLKHEGDDGPAKILSYTLTLGSDNSPATIRLWYDPKSFRLFKRTVKIREKQGIRSITETYNSVIINRDIGDDQFTPPEPLSDEM